MADKFDLPECRKLAGQASYDHNFEPYELGVRLALRAACDEIESLRATVAKLRAALLELKREAHIIHETVIYRVTAERIIDAALKEIEDENR
jgi:hypothetical protein